MSLKNLVKGQVRQAFTLIKDLAIDVTLTKADATEYDFGDKEAVLTTPVVKVVKAVLMEKGRRGSQVKDTYLLLNAEDLDDPDIYDKVTINGVTYTIVPPHDSNGYTISIKIVKEA